MLGMASNILMSYVGKPSTAIFRQVRIPNELHRNLSRMSGAKLPQVWETLERAKASVVDNALLKAETVKRAVVRGNVDAPVGNGQSAEVVERSNLVFAGV